MIALCKRLRLEFEDWLRYHPRIRRSICRLQLLRSRRARPARSPSRRPRHRQALRRRPACRGRRTGAAHPGTHCSPNPASRRRPARLERIRPRLQRSAHLQSRNPEAIRRPRRKRRPVRLLRRAMDQIAAARELPPAGRALQRSWSRRATVRRTCWSTTPFRRSFPGPVFTLISNPNDVAVFPRMSSNLIVVPLYASSWVNPDLFEPLPKSQRSWDLLMVANFAKFKRHHAFFAALRSMPSDLRILLIGQNQDGRDRRHDPRDGPLVRVARIASRS